MKIKNFTLSIGLFMSLLTFTYAQNPGDLDLGFGTNGIVVDATEGQPIESFQTVAIQNDQKIIAAGMSWDDNYIARATVVRYMPDGTLDADFGEDGKFIYEFDNEALIYSCVINDEGKIILAGSTTDYVNNRVLLIQLNSDGTPDDTFGDNGVVIQKFSLPDVNYQDFALGVTLDANGNILISGSSYNEDYLKRPFVARFSPNGEVDTNFGVNGVATIPVVQDGNSFDCLTIQPDGKILAAGTFSPEFLWNVMLLVRYNEDGTLDGTFGQEGIIRFSQNNVDDEVFSMALTPTGNIVLAGFSATTTYNYYGLIVQFTPAGILDNSFGTNGVILENEHPYNEQAGIQIQSDGKIVVAGTTGNPPPGAFDFAVWKYNADGTRDLSFGTTGLASYTIDGYYGMLHGMALQNDNKIVAVGKARTELNDNDFLILRLENGIVSGINEIDFSKAPTVSPNPVLASGQINIHLMEALDPNANIEFYDMAGKLIQSTPVKNTFVQNQTITTTLPSELSNGIYLVKISQNRIQTAATKLVVIN